MKNKLYLLLICLSFGIFQKAEACLDPDTSIIITVNYDTIDAQPCPLAREMEIRISNIRMMSEAPNKLCACALASFSGMFTDLVYIAFVDSGTNDPYDGFAQFNENAKSTAAWASKYSSSGSWKGMVAKVVNSGLKATDPVELLIRAKAPANTSVVFNDSLCGPDITDKLVQSSLGTDEWDGSNETLKNAHQRVRGMSNVVQTSEMSKQHFKDLDKEIETALNLRKDAPVWFFGQNGATLYPNPSDGDMTINLKLATDENVLIEWIDLTGRSQVLQPSAMYGRGEHQVAFSLNSLGIDGSGFIKVSFENEVQVLKVMRL